MLTRARRYPLPLFSNMKFVKHNMGVVITVRYCKNRPAKRNLQYHTLFLSFHTLSKSVRRRLCNALVRCEAFQSCLPVHMLTMVVRQHGRPP